MNILIRSCFKQQRPILEEEEEAPRRTYYKQSSASSALFFIFTSCSSLKGSFVVYWLIEFNEEHSIVTNIGFTNPTLCSTHVLPLRLCFQGFFFCPSAGLRYNSRASFHKTCFDGWSVALGGTLFGADLNHWADTHCFKRYEMRRFND